MRLGGGQAVAVHSQANVGRLLNLTGKPKPFCAKSQSHSVQKAKAILCKKPKPFCAKS
jgi:hypothetical protein